MKWLILNTDYPHFLDALYADHPGLATQSYDAQMQARNDSLFGVCDFFSSNLRALGHEAWDVHYNNELLQRAWAVEHGLDIETGGRSSRPSALHQLRVLSTKLPLQSLLQMLRPLGQRLAKRRTWRHDVLLAQARHYAPDVIVNHDPVALSLEFLAELKACTRLLVGQIAAPVPAAGRDSLAAHDVVVSSFPHFVHRFRADGIKSEYMPLSFEPRVLDVIHPSSFRPIPAAFVGSISVGHRERVALLEQVCSETGLAIWGAADSLPASSPARRCHRGRAWGRAMFEVLGDARVALNQHIDVADSYANNMRLFEATGMGAMLLTDAKQNLEQLFSPGSEVVTYANAAECVERLRYYVEHEDERAAIAAAGQQRTLRDHTYAQRMRELADIAEKYLS